MYRLDREETKFVLDGFYWVPNSRLKTLVSPSPSHSKKFRPPNLVPIYQIRRHRTTGFLLNSAFSPADPRVFYAILF